VLCVGFVGPGTFSNFGSAFGMNNQNTNQSLTNQSLGFGYRNTNTNGFGNTSTYGTSNTTGAFNTFGNSKYRKVLFSYVLLLFCVFVCFVLFVYVCL